MLISVDVEADGPCPGLYSMIELGAVVVERNNKGLWHSFLNEIHRDTLKSHKPTLLAMGWTEDSLDDRDAFRPKEAMENFARWLNQVSEGERLYFISDNNGFDWQFVNYYCHKFLGHNPFGHSSLNINCFYKGLKKDVRESWRGLRVTKHTHNALDDATGNAEAILKFEREIKGLV